MNVLGPAGSISAAARDYVGFVAGQSGTDFLDHWNPAAGPHTFAGRYPVGHRHFGWNRQFRGPHGHGDERHRAHGHADI